MQYVPSESNEADAPSRCLNYSDACLSENAWQLVEEKFGPHSMDLMSLYSNVMKSKDGTGLTFYPISNTIFIECECICTEPEWGKCICTYTSCFVMVKGTERLVSVRVWYL